MLCPPNPPSHWIQPKLPGKLTLDLGFGMWKKGQFPTLKALFTF
jgi:hypothetical protein